MPREVVADVIHGPFLFGSAAGLSTAAVVQGESDSGLTGARVVSCKCSGVAFAQPRRVQSYMP